MSESVIPSPSEADFALNLSDCYRTVGGLKVMPATIARAAIRLAMHYKQQVEALVGLDATDVDALLERWDQTEPGTRRLIVARLAALTTESQDAVTSLNRTNAQIHEAQLRLTQALARIIERSEDSDVREIAATALGRVPPK